MPRSAGRTGPAAGRTTWASRQRTPPAARPDRSGGGGDPRAAPRPGRRQRPPPPPRPDSGIGREAWRGKGEKSGGGGLFKKKKNKINVFQRETQRSIRTHRRSYANSKTASMTDLTQPSRSRHISNKSERFEGKFVKSYTWTN